MYLNILLNKLLKRKASPDPWLLIKTSFNDFSIHRTIKGHIDQIKDVLYIERKNVPVSSRFDAINNWATQIAAVNDGISARLFWLQSLD